MPMLFDECTEDTQDVWSDNAAIILAILDNDKLFDWYKASGLYANEFVNQNRTALLTYLNVNVK